MSHLLSVFTDIASVIPPLNVSASLFRYNYSVKNGDEKIPHPLFFTPKVFMWKYVTNSKLS